MFNYKCFFLDTVKGLGGNDLILMSQRLRSLFVHFSRLAALLVNSAGALNVFITVLMYRQARLSGAKTAGTAAASAGTGIEVSATVDTLQNSVSPPFAASDWRQYR